MLTPLNAFTRGLQAWATNIELNPIRLHHLTQRAIAASAALTAACSAGRAITDAHYAAIDHAADAARHDLLVCLKRDFGIDETMAIELGALL